MNKPKPKDLTSIKILFGSKSPDAYKASGYNEACFQWEAYLAQKEKDEQSSDNLPNV